MKNNTDRLVTWLKTFQTVWLPENLPNDSHLLQSIKQKLHEFEQIITEPNDNDDEEEYHRARLLNDHSVSNSETEEIPIASTSTYETYIEQPLNLPRQSDEEERARQLLLEQSDASDEDEVFLQPSIRLKRISQVDAERYIPSAWKKDQKSSSTSDSTSEDEEEEEEDYNIKYRTRQSLSNNTEKSSIQLRTSTKLSRKKTNDIFINYTIPAIVDELSLEGSLTIPEDIGPMDEDGVLNDLIENNDNESILASLTNAQEKPMEMTPTEEIVDVPNEPIEELSDEDPSEDRAPIEVPSYAHLLNQSQLSSSDTENPKEKKRIKRTTISPPDSDSTPIKKKSRVAIRQRVALSSSSSSSDENENNRTLTNGDDAASSPQTASRIQIQRSSSEDSNNHSRQSRIKTAVSNERSSALKEIKRKTRAKKSSKSSTTSNDSADRPRHQKNKSLSSDESESNSNDDDDDDDDETSPSKGRKNIRKILDDKELDIQTKDAIVAERERRKRIAENQKKYNDTFLEQSFSQPNNSTEEQPPAVNPRLILELDKTTNEPLIEVEPKLVEQMKPHQCDGVRFLWNNVFESIDAIEKKKSAGNGCILAHCMGLGKTLQVISFIHTIFNSSHLTKVKTCLVLCPKNAALNWSNEIDHWLNGIEPSIDHYQLATIKPHLRVTHLSYWYENGGVMIMGYDIYRQFVNGNRSKNKKTKDELMRYLVDPGPDIVVADEGHILKNSQTALAKCLSKIKTRRRIVLTGTPLQNNLIEYYCMVSFIKPNLLGSQQEYINRFVNPIQNGQHRDSNEDDVRLMKRRACVLHELLTGFVDRKDYSLLQEYLPPKYEYIINIRLSDLQSKLYETYLDKVVNKEQRSLGVRKDFQSAKLFADFNYLQKIWTHPFLLYPHFIERWKKQFQKDDDTSIDDNESELMFIDDEENIQRKKDKSSSSYSGFLIDNIKNEVEPKPPRGSSSSTTTIDSDSPIDGENESSSKTSHDNDDDDDEIEIIRTYPTRSRTTINEPEKPPPPAADEPETNSDDAWLNEMREQFWFPILDPLPKESEFDLELSGKFLLLKYLLDKCTDIGDKIILFSRSLLTLNHIEKFLRHLHKQNAQEYESQQQYREYLSSTAETEPIINEPVQWQRDLDYFRMDGQTEVLARKRYTKTFNNLSNIRARLFLISTLAGGIGINLVGSNRVIVFDASWNPSHDTQAIFRSYRFGQKKPVYIYRFLAHGTMEEKIYQRQVVKQSLSQRVIDDHQLDRHFTQSDIKELYKFQSEPLPEASTTSTALNFNYAIPKDHLLLDLLYEHNRWVHSYHSHDSLLENKIDEGLTADERRRALEEYENLKRLPDPRQVALERFQQQQQQQRLNQYIAQQNLAAQLQQVNPNIYQAISRMSSQRPQLAQMMQQLQTMGLMNGTTNNNNNNRTTVGPVPIQPKPTNSSNPIMVESDEESHGDTLPK